MKYCIIQPATWEGVQSGVCFTPYWLYAGLKEVGHEVYLYEDVTLRSFNRIPINLNRIPIKEYDRVFVDLSSYPQQDVAMEIVRSLEVEGATVSCVGYAPLIVAKGLHYDAYAEVVIKQGVFRFPYYHHYFKPDFFSDGDPHIRGWSRDRRIMPVFLSVGCKRGCPYCYVSHSNYPYGQDSRRHVSEIIQYCADREWDVHFCDEDFAANPEIATVLKSLAGKGVQYLCLASSTSLARLLEEYGEDYLYETGMRVVEIGYETADAKVLKKAQDIERVAAMKKVNPFWLTVTFMPGETVQSLRATGEFLREQGYQLGELTPRMQTNSTAGGLGQFFHAYHGTPWYWESLTAGEVLTETPTRLWPSFVPDSFLDQTLK